MTYLQPSNRTKTSARRSVFVSIVVIVLFASGFIFAPNFFFSITSKVFSPIWRFEFFALGSFENALAILKSKSSLVKENEALLLERERFASERLYLAEVVAQNEEFKELLGRSEDVSRVLGVVLRRPPFSPYDSLILDAGLRQGVSVGDKVYGPGQVLMGDIIEVEKSLSKAELYSSPGKETLVLIGPRSVSGTAIGRGGGNFILSLPIDVLVEKGDVIKAPSINVSILGVVEYVETDSAESIQTVYFKSPFNINDINFVDIFALPQ